MQKNQQQYIIKSESELIDVELSLSPGDRVFFSGDLGAGKTTLIRSILRRYTWNPDIIVRSPTYTYYEKYVSIDPSTREAMIFHFDLYRLEDIDTFYSIGGMEIAEDPNSIMLIEWPEILGDLIQPTKKVSIEVIDTDRKIVVEYP